MELEAKVLGVIPDSEVPAKATRRRFTVQYKLRVLREAEGVQGIGRGPGVFSAGDAAVLFLWNRKPES